MAKPALDTTNMNFNEYVAVKDVAAFLRLDERTIRRMIWAGCVDFR